MSQFIRIVDNVSPANLLMVFFYLVIINTEKIVGFNKDNSQSFCQGSGKGLSGKWFEFKEILRFL